MRNQRSGEGQADPAEGLLLHTVATVGIAYRGRARTPAGGRVACNGNCRVSPRQ